ncbi:MAG: arylsulfatase [Leadbetterella sp.]
MNIPIYKKGKLVALLFVLLGHLPIIAQSSKPNIIYILADDLGWAELGCYGQKKIKTPHLDKLAAQGVRFTHFYSGSPVCAPSRCILLTGKHSGHSQVRQNKEIKTGLTDEQGQFPLVANTFTIGTMLKNQGYKTACIGKWGLGGPGTDGIPRKNGFDYFYGYLDQKQAHNLYPTHLWRNESWDTLDNVDMNPHPKLTEKEKLDSKIYQKFIGNEFAPYKINEEAIRFIENNKKEPFFLYYTPVAPHLALQIPDSEIEKFGYDFQDLPYLADKGYTPHNRPKAAYAASISLLDEHIGNLIKTLEKEGILENTILFFSSDNGAAYDIGGVDAKFFESVKNLRGLKGSLYEGGIRVPFIVNFGNNIKANRVVSIPSISYDIMATIHDLIQSSIPIETDGISLLPLIKGEKYKNKRTFYWEFAGYGGQKAIRMGKWKGVFTDLVKNANPKMQLYNIDIDGSEQLDVSISHQKIVKKLTKKMAESHQNSPVHEWNF